MYLFISILHPSAFNGDCYWIDGGALYHSSVDSKWWLLLDWCWQQAHNKIIQLIFIIRRDDIKRSLFSIAAVKYFPIVMSICVMLLLVTFMYISMIHIYAILFDNISPPILKSWLAYYTIVCVWVSQWKWDYIYMQYTFILCKCMQYIIYNINIIIYKHNSFNFTVYFWLSVYLLVLRYKLLCMDVKQIMIAYKSVQQ